MKMYLRRIVPEFERGLNRKTWKRGKVLIAPANFHWKDIVINRLIAGTKRVPYDNKWSKVRMQIQPFEPIKKGEKTERKFGL